MGDFETKVVRNALFILFARVWFLVVGLFVTPYILSRIGNEEFGIWLLVGVFVGYVGIVDFGLGASFVKFIAERNARGDRRGVSGVFTTGIVVYLLLTLVIVAGAYLSVDGILRVLSIPPGMDDEARFVVKLAFLGLLGSNVVLVYRSVVDGVQRMDLSTGISVVASIASIAGTVVVLELGFGIRGLAVNQLITYAMTIVMTVYCAHRVSPGLRFALGDARRNFAELFRYGVNLQIGNIASLINFNFDKLLVNRYIDVTHVTFYEVGSRLPWTLRGLPMVVLSPLIPATSELEVRQGRAAVYELFERVSKYLSFFAFPLFGGVIVTGQAFIETWVGQGYGSSVTVMRILCVGYFFYTLAAPSSHMVAGLGRPEYPRNAEVFNLILNLVLSIALIRRFGFYGAPLGTSIAMTAAAAYYVWAFHRFVGRPLLPFLKSTLVKPAVCAITSGLVALAVTTTLGPYLPGSRLYSLLMFIAGGALFTALYVLLAVKVSYVGADDLRVLRHHVPFLRS
jgi:O-antigen/teichoic acid export membrane protein